MQKFNSKQKFGQAVKVWRSLLGISQEELAERANLHRTYISDVERGARNLSLLSMEKLAAALDVSISSFFDLPAAKGASESFKPACNLKRKFVKVLLVEDNADDVALTLHAFTGAPLVLVTSSLSSNTRS